MVISYSSAVLGDERGLETAEYVLEYLHTGRDVRREWLPRVRKIASNGKSSIIATLDQMPGVR